MLDRLQRGLERLYRLEPAPSINAFMIEHGSPAAGGPARREQLLIVEEEDLFIGVLIEPAAVDRLADDRLADANLEAFCLAVEGVSHFLFVMHRVREAQPTTILELELQAEVDKYVAALMLAVRCSTLPAERLRGRLYDGYQLLSGLSVVEQRRYHKANLLARRYARCLERRFVRRRRLPAMLGELRRFYRLSYRGKRELIHRAA